MSYNKRQQNNDLPEVFQRLGNTSRSAYRKQQHNNNETNGLRIARYNDPNHHGRGYPDYSKISQLQDDAVFYTPNNNNNNNNNNSNYFADDTDSYLHNPTPPPRANSFRFVRHNPPIERPIISFLRDTPPPTYFNPQPWSNSEIIHIDDDTPEEGHHQQQQRNFSIAKKIQITTSLPSNTSNKDSDAPINKRKITVTPQETSPVKKKFKAISPPRNKRRRSPSPSRRPRHISSDSSDQDEAPFLNLKSDVYTPHYAKETGENINKRLSGIKKYKELRACPPLGSLDPSAAPRLGASASTYHKVWIKPSETLPPSKKLSPSSPIAAKKPVPEPVTKKLNSVAAPVTEPIKATSTIHQDPVSKVSAPASKVSFHGSEDYIPTGPANDTYAFAQNDKIPTGPAADRFTFVKKAHTSDTLHIPTDPSKNDAVPLAPSEPKRSKETKELKSTSNHASGAKVNPNGIVKPMTTTRAPLKTPAHVQPAIVSPKSVHASKPKHISHNIITAPNIVHAPYKRTPDTSKLTSNAANNHLNGDCSATNNSPSSTTSVPTTVKHGNQNNGKNIIKANPSVVQDEANKNLAKRVRRVFTDGQDRETINKRQEALEQDKKQKDLLNQDQKRFDQERKAALDKEKKEALDKQRKKDLNRQREEALDRQRKEAMERQRKAKEILRQLAIDERDDVVMDIAPLTRNVVIGSPIMGLHNSCKKALNSPIIMKEEPMDDDTHVKPPTTVPAANETIESSINETVETTVSKAIESAVNKTIKATVESVVNETIESVANGTLGIAESAIQEDTPMPDVVKPAKKIPTIITEENTLNLLLSEPHQLASPPTSSHSEEPSSILPIIPTKKSESPLKLNIKKMTGRVPRPWKIVMTDSGEMYYHNPITGEKSQERPVA